MTNRNQGGSRGRFPLSGRFSVLLCGGLLGCFAATLALPGSCHATRIKDVAAIDGVRENELVGYGLVVGLNGTGDSQMTNFPTQSLANFLERSGLTISKSEMQVKNVAAVLVTAALPAFARQGTRIDVNVSSLGDAKSITGGQLMLTQLKGVDGMVYATSAGAVVTGGDKGGHPTAGRIAAGGLVEKELPDTLSGAKKAVLNLYAPDFTTSSRLAAVINGHFQPGTALARNPGMVEIAIPAQYQQEPVDFFAEMESLPIEPDVAAKVIVNEKTGTVVMGEEVRVLTCAISHGNLSVKVVDSAAQSPTQASAAPPVPGRSAPQGVSVQRVALLRKGVSIGDLVKSLNAMGATPKDLVVILQSLKSAGALQAELVVN